MPDWRPALGALWDGRETAFRVWAPDHQSVHLVLDREAGRPRPLAGDADGYWTGTFEDVRPGDLYRYRLDRDEGRTFPDPASRFQPAGVHGPSEVIDPSAFAWTDGGFRPHSLAELAFYELHVGTFTPAGTFAGATERLDYLASLGVSAIELMPVADFAGERNWGYDVAAMFAPSRAYGHPDDLRALVDAAHARGLSVFLDVVYNHLGPDGAYIAAFSRRYFSNRHTTPWGASINLDGPRAEAVRRFFVENALHWIREYHVDGLRLDATHALIDDGPRHFLAEFADDVRARAGRPVHLVAEDHRNLAQLALPATAGGFGLDAVWADDLHHQLRVHTAHDHEGYYADYRGSAADIAATLRRGWFYTGQATRTTGKPRGTETAGLRPQQFVVCIQNHDQIGNRADGARLNQHVDLATFRALSTLIVLAPQTPLLFMGQEWAASSPFLFFTDHHRELGEQVTAGRRAEFESFVAFSDPRRQAEIPDPQAVHTFERSRLDWAERTRPPHADTLRLYRALLKLRRLLVRSPVRREDVDARALDEHTVAVTLPGASIVVRLSGQGTVAFPTEGAGIVLTTEHVSVAPDPQPIHMDERRVTFERPGALVVSTSLAPQLSITPNRP